MSGSNKNSVNHGHWRVYGYSYTCSNCGCNRIGGTKYCMNCGSLMDEAEEHVIPKINFSSLPQRIICPFCGQDIVEVRKMVRFCYNCGMRLGDEQIN